MVQTKQFTVPINPMGKPRMTRKDKWAKRPCVQKYWDWKDVVVAAAGEVPDAETITDLSWTAHIAMPKSWSKKRKDEMDGAVHRSKPDRDNIDKALLDALFDEDSAIADGTLSKRWAREGRIDVVIGYEVGDGSNDGDAT